MDLIAETAALAVNYAENHPGTGVLIAEDVARVLGLTDPIDELPDDDEIDALAFDLWESVCAGLVDEGETDDFDPDGHLISEVPSSTGHG